MDHLTYEEIELLMDGLDALQAKASSSRLLGGVLGASLARDKEQRDEMLGKLTPDETEKREQKLLEERIVFIKAKLISLRDSIEARAIAQD